MQTVLARVTATILRAWPKESTRFRPYPHLQTRRWERAAMREQVVMVLSGAVDDAEALHAWHRRCLDEEFMIQDQAVHLTKAVARIHAVADAVRRPWDMLSPSEQEGYRLIVAITDALAPDPLRAAA